jgi:hypothetical protein
MSCLLDEIMAEIKQISLAAYQYLRKVNQALLSAHASVYCLQATGPRGE